MNEKIYKKIGSIGGLGIAMGIIILVTVLPLGILSIVNGARALHLKKNILI